LVFVLTSVVFCTYDRCVARRQSVLKDTAERSTEVISSLFPRNVRDRMFDAKTGAMSDESRRSVSSTNRTSASSGLSKSFVRRSCMMDASSRNSGGRFNHSSVSPFDNDEDITFHESLPIADLYPSTSVFFADIAGKQKVGGILWGQYIFTSIASNIFPFLQFNSGFTKWSSEREPQEVFQLLETLYGRFDKTAKRLKVFKIETIGDCYVCVTGIPHAQTFHAVILARFAARCLTDMSYVCHKLAGLLGEDTATLGLRVGIHSGPVTAGVLRGEKARFQLFGDTVNTAARMESNGMKGRIQATKQTADLICAAGKVDWVRKREDMIAAKGKGLLQTYWIEPKGDAAMSNSSCEQEGSMLRATRR